jgi:hypothetical protein
MELHRSIPKEVHPAGAATIHHWTADALAALDNGDFAEVERLSKMIDDKIELERPARRGSTTETPRS